MRCLLPLVVLSFCLPRDVAQAESPKKYALLAAVTRYEHAGMNVPQLEYPEADAKALGEFLTSFGYEVELLLGKQATQSAIRKKLESLNTKGEADGVALIGLFGHGVLVDAGSGSDPEGCFCPYDVPVRFVKDRNGKILNNDNGEPMTEPDPAKLIKISEILLSLKIAKAGNRVVLADCCRKQPNQARGRNLGVGASFKVSDIPDNTAVLFGCSPNQQAFEHKDWGHGAFTRCLLDELTELARQGDDATTGVIADRLKKKVPKLVASRSPTDRQVPKPFSNDSIDLQLTFQVSAKFEGSKAGERRELAPGIAFRWCPPGEFVMGCPKSEFGSDGKHSAHEDQIRITLKAGYWLGETELTQGQWKESMETRPWKGKSDAMEGDDFPVSWIDYSNSVEFCQRLSARERLSKRLPSTWKYSLPTEEQWEYACRAGSQTRFSFGESESTLAEYAWIDRTAVDIGEKYAHRVGQKKPNSWGFRDMHGNVSEWCSWNNQQIGPRNPIGKDATFYQAMRGGNWLLYSTECRSACRSFGLSDNVDPYTGFRLAITLEKTVD